MSSYDAPHDKRNIAVFIASPNDLATERKQFRQTIDILNHGFGDGAGVEFEPLGWEDTLSTVSNRSQSLINNDIDRCDVFVLALNRRWGQDAPDSEYSSYTEEEFHRALNRFHSSGVPTLFIFFKRVDPASEGDPGPQLAKIMEFRQSLEDSRQIIYRYFDDTVSFAKEVERHLRAYAKDELPSANSEPAKLILPLPVLGEIKEAKEAAKLANERAELESSRAAELALQLAEDAAEAALEGRIEKARQRFAQAIIGTVNTRILYLAFEFYHRTGDLHAAENTLQQWLAVSEEKSLDMAAAYGNLGLVYRTRGALDEAETVFRKALALNEELGRKEGMASNYGNLGLVHRTRGALDEAETMYRKALTLNEELGRKEGMANQYGNLGNVYRTRGALDEAETMFRKSLTLNEELGRKEGMASQYDNLGLVYRTRGALDEAEAMFRRALTLNVELGRKEGMASNYGNLGLVYRTRGMLDEAETMCRKAIVLFEELGSPTAENVQTWLTELLSERDGEAD